MIEIITIKGKDYTLEEARELYIDLHELFGTSDHCPTIYPPGPPYTWTTIETTTEQGVWSLQ